MVALGVRIRHLCRTDPEDLLQDRTVGLGARLETPPVLNAATINDVVNRGQGRTCRFDDVPMKHDLFWYVDENSVIIANLVLRSQRPHPCIF